jgi:tetratricopeptide (TPR) repeat protein
MQAWFNTRPFFLPKLAHNLTHVWHLAFGARKAGPMSRLLADIQKRLAVETDPQRRAELIARLAAYAARVGSFDEARSLIAEVRKVFNDGRSARVTALVMIGEAMIAHYEELGVQALDRLKRAQLLADMTRDRDLAAVAAAWRAHVEFQESSLEAAARSLKHSFDSAGPDNQAAHARCAIVLFMAFAFLGDRTEAQRWFNVGREAALAEGDQASIDALVHNKAAFDVAFLWALKGQGSPDPGWLQHARTQVESAKNLQQLVRVVSFDALIDLCDARLLILEEKFEAAVEAFERIRPKGPLPTQHYSPSLADTEVAYCLTKLGKIEEALKVFERCRNTSHTMLDVDDRLVAAWMTFEMARTDPRFLELDAATATLELARREYDMEITAARQVFAPFAAPFTGR